MKQLTILVGAYVLIAALVLGYYIDKRFFVSWLENRHHEFVWGQLALVSFGFWVPVALIVVIVWVRAFINSCEPAESEEVAPRSLSVQSPDLSIPNYMDRL